MSGRVGLGWFVIWVGLVWFVGLLVCWFVWLFVPIVQAGDGVCFPSNPGSSLAKELPPVLVPRNQRYPHVRIVTEPTRGSLSKENSAGPRNVRFHVERRVILSLDWWFGDMTYQHLRRILPCQLLALEMASWCWPPNLTPGMDPLEGQALVCFSREARITLAHFAWMLGFQLFAN